MWNTFSSLHSRFKIYKGNYLAPFAKPKKHLKASQQKMFHGDRLGLLSFPHKAVSFKKKKKKKNHASLH